MKFKFLFGLCMVVVLLFISGCRDEKHCDMFNREIIECNGWSSLDKNFEIDFWKNFSSYYDIEVSNYDWCSKISNCDLTINKYVANKDKYIDYSSCEGIFEFVEDRFSYKGNKDKRILVGRICKFK